MPVLLYGSENWILSEACLAKLEESYLGGMVKRVLRWPKHLSNTAALLALGMETVRSRVLSRKLASASADGGCNHRYYTLRYRYNIYDATGVGTLAVWAMLDDPDSLCIIKDCHDLEAEYSTGYTDKILTNADEVCMREVKREIKKCDRKLQMNR